MEEPAEIPPWERGLEEMDASVVDLDTFISLFKERPPSELGRNGRTFPTSHRSWSAMNLAQRAKASEFWSNLDQNVKEDLYKLNLERSSLRKKKDRGWSKSDVVRLLHHKKEPSLASRWATIMNGRSSRAQLVRQPYSPLLSLQLTLPSLYFHDDEYDHNGDELRL